MVFIKPTIVRDGETMSGIAGRKYNYFRALQLDQRKRGVNLMPDTQVPVLDEWDGQQGMTPEMNDIIERYKSGKGLDTPVREKETVLKSISDSMKKDSADE